MIAITRGIDIVMGFLIIISEMAQSVITVIKITMVNCQFNANDRVDFWSGIGQRFWIPGFPVDYSISDDLVRECNPGGRGFDVTASQTMQGSRSCSCN